MSGTPTMARARTWTSPLPGCRVTKRGARSQAGRSAAVALLVLEPGAAPAHVVAADLGAGGRVAGPRLLPRAHRGHAGAASRAGHARSGHRPDARPLRGSARCPGTDRRGCPGTNRQRAARLLARPGHRKDACWWLRLLLDRHPEDRARDPVLDEPGQLLVQPERLLAELVQRVLL